MLSFGKNSRVVLIGTSKSNEDSVNLPEIPQVKNNISELKNVFCSPEIVGLQENEEIVELLDQERAEDILRQIKVSAREATDTLLVYYSGHGIRGGHDENLYLCSKNTVFEDKEITGVPISLVRKAMADSSATKRILILDCCYAGAALTGALSAGDVAVDAIDLRGTFGIAAVPQNAKAHSNPDGVYTTFTKHFLNVMKRGVKNGKDFVTIDEVFENVKSVINSEAEFPVPKKNNMGDVEDFMFCYNNIEKKGYAFLKKEVERLNQLIASSDESKTEEIQNLTSKIQELSKIGVMASQKRGSGISLSSTGPIVAIGLLTSAIAIYLAVSPNHLLGSRIDNAESKIVQIEDNMSATSSVVGEFIEPLRNDLANLAKMSNHMTQLAALPPTTFFQLDSGIKTKSRQELEFLIDNFFGFEKVNFRPTNVRIIENESEGTFSLFYVRDKFVMLFRDGFGLDVAIEDMRRNPLTGQITYAQANTNYKIGLSGMSENHFVLFNESRRFPIANQEITKHACELLSADRSYYGVNEIDKIMVTFDLNYLSPNSAVTNSVTDRVESGGEFFFRLMPRLYENLRTDGSNAVCI